MRPACSLLLLVCIFLFIEGYLSFQLCTTLRATSNLNVRGGPCTNEPLITTISSGTTVTFMGTQIVGCGYTWLRVRGSFGSGFAASNWLQSVSPPKSGSVPSVTMSQLMQLMPNLPQSKAMEYIGYLNNALKEGKLNTCFRVSAFLAQLAHESGELQWFEEFASGEAYEGRLDLGNTEPGDGVKYKGRGPIQLTGRANYRDAGKALNLDLEGNPTLAATPEVGFRTAVWFWNTRSLNYCADQGTQNAFDEVTRRVNGGFNGKDHRDSYWTKMKKILGC